jgi:hypothetical protein
VGTRRNTGKALGAVVNAITYSGTNDFEASVFGFTAGSALSAGAKSEPTFRQTTSLKYDVGARIGGPLIARPAWYSAAYNPRRERTDLEVLGFRRFPRRADNAHLCYETHVARHSRRER